MKAATFASCAVLGLACTAYGADSLVNFTQVEPRVYDVRSGQWLNQSAFTSRAGAQTIYSNVAAPTSLGVQHNVAGEVVGDDTTPSFASPGDQFGQVLEVTISIANFGAPIAGQRVSLDVLFFKNDGSGLGGAPIAGTQIGSIPIEILSMSLGSQQFGLFTFSGLSGLTLQNERMWMAVRFNNVGTADGTQLGQVFFGTPTVGSSSNTEFFRDSASVNPQFSAGTTNNFAYAIVVPAPGAAAVLGLGGLVAVRRRRR